MSEQPPQLRARWLLVCLCALVALVGLGGSAWRIATEGVGVLGANNAVPWGWDIVSFVFWIGLGHAGTLISAMLLLSRQSWRGEIARHAELMTLCAILTAAIYPLVHVGRIWMLWLLSPLPVASGVWPNMASPLLWDALAIGSYFVLSLLFWLIGLRGERPSACHLRPLWGRICMGMAVVLTVLVITVHSVVGCDFAVVFRWHALGLPPYFVCGALLSGMAAVQLIELGVHRGHRSLCREPLARLTLVFSLAMGLFYALELWESPGLWSGGYAIMLVCNVLLPGVYWCAAARGNRPLIALVSVGVLLGMWWERVHIIVCRSEWHTAASYAPSGVDVAMLCGGVGLFLALFLAFSARMPREQACPAAAAALPGGHQPARVALLGATVGLLLPGLWYAATQWADTAGVVSARPLGYPFIVPPLLVCALLGAGLALALLFYFHLRKHS